MLYDSCKGILKHADGIVPIWFLRQQRSRYPEEEMWQIEMLCRQPTVFQAIWSTLLLNQLFKNAKKDWDDAYGYCCSAIDWGLVNPTTHVVGRFINDKIAIEEARLWVMADLGDRIKWIIEDIVKFHCSFCFADAEGAEQNRLLKKKLAQLGIPCAVVPVAFNKYKDKGIIQFRNHLETGALLYSNQIKDKKIYEFQMKKYHTKEGTDKPEKKDDHFPDATIALMRGKFGAQPRN